jgi:hypothetical protein
MVTMPKLLPTMHLHVMRIDSGRSKPLWERPLLSFDQFAALIGWPGHLSLLKKSAFPAIDW